jgi:hypothetical protein
MRITRIRLRNYRGIQEHELRLPPTGVTVVQGDNEVGKSSIAEAIDLLFDYHDSSTHKVVKAVKPVHRDAGAEVEADVEAGPYRFTYTKRFHRDRATTLVISAPRRENLTGREAHERALAILDEAVDVPLWRALRLQQGVRPDQADLSEQTSLAAALDAASAGALAGEREATLIDRSRAEFERYWTPSGRALKAEVLALQRAEQDAEAKVDELRRRLADLEDDVEHAATLVVRIAELGIEAEEQRGRVGHYEKQWRSVETLLHDVTEARLAAQVATAEARNAEAESSRRHALLEDVERAERCHQERVAEHRRHEPAVAAAADALAAAEERLVAVSQLAREADILLRQRRADLQVHNDLLHLEMLSERWQRVQEADARLAELDVLLDTNRVDDAALQAIEDAHLAAVQARARVEGESPAIEVEAIADVEVMLDGRPVKLSAGEARTASVASTTVLQVGDVARVTVRPSREAGSSAAALAEAEARLAEARLADALAAAGVADIGAARDAATVRRDAIRQRDHLVTRTQDDLRDLTPERMGRKIERLQARIAEARPGAAETETADLDTARRLVEEAEAIVGTGQDARREAEDDVVRRRRELEVVRGRAEASKNEVEIARRQLEAARNELEAARAERPDGVLAGRLEAALKRSGDADKALARASAAADKARPDELRATFENATAVLDKLEAERSGAQQTHAEVRARLAVWGEEGLHDRLAEAEAEAEHRRRERKATERRAHAARRLFETLDRCRGEARRAYVAPLQAKIEAFGRIVFGDDFSVELGEDLRIVRRTRRGVTVDFDQLSTGTREQLCVISRLACAAIVAGGDGGVPVILDDALGWSDAKRLERLGAVLSLAAADAQVLVLTCLPDRYRHVGAAHVIHLS